jgi:hypothetical protein
MIITGFVAVLLASAAAHSARVFEVLERSYELRLSSVVFPEAANGSIAFIPCATCQRKAMPVSSETSYFVNGMELTLSGLREEAARIRRSESGGSPTLVVLHYDPATDVATRVRIEER